MGDVEDLKKMKTESNTQLANEKEEASKKCDILEKQFSDLQIEFEGKLAKETKSKESVSVELEKYMERVRELESLCIGLTDSSEHKELEVHYSDIELDLETLGNTARSTVSSKSETTD